MKYPQCLIVWSTILQLTTNHRIPHLVKAAPGSNTETTTSHDSQQDSQRDFKELIVLPVHSSDSSKLTASVIVIDNLIRVLRYGDALLGATFEPDEYKDQSPFTAFALMRSGACRIKKAFDRGEKSRVGSNSETRMLQMGLGVGTVPMFAKWQCGYDVVDAWENSTAVAQLAQDYFGYNISNSDKLTRQTKGSLHLVEAKAKLFQRQAKTNKDDEEKEDKEEEKYDLVVQDLYLGFNPTHMLCYEVFTQVKAAWLSPSRGVYMVNFVTHVKKTTSGQEEKVNDSNPQEVGKVDKSVMFEDGTFAQDVVSTLRAVFSAVSCFRDSPASLVYEQKLPCNVVCFASDHGALLQQALFHNRPQTTAEEEEPSDEEIDGLWVEQHFEQWGVLQPDDSQGCAAGNGGANKECRILTEQTDMQPYQASFQHVEAGVKKMIRPLLPEHFWPSSSF